MPLTVKDYFPDITELQINRFSKLEELYHFWNSRINVISRKDMDNLFVHHILHSLSVARIISFKPGTRILDAGTGGGFPGIPLAIMFPHASFTLLDSIAKKISVVSSVTDALGLSNVKPLRKRIEEEKDRYDFVISRAVTRFPAFVSLTMKNIDKRSFNDLPNGIIYLKGGDFQDELESYKERVSVYNIAGFFDHPYFDTKKIIYLPAEIPEK